MDNGTAVNDYITAFAGGDDGPVAAAAAHADEVGAPPLDVAAGALLRWLARHHGTRTVVEIGGAAGVSGLWLLQGMQTKSTLTSIESRPEVRDAARRAYAAAGAADHVRSILGDPGQVLPRLADRAYDMVLLGEEAVDRAGHLEHLTRLVHPGGLLVALGVLAGAGAHDADAGALRAFTDAVAEDDRWDAVLLPFAGGVLVAQRMDDPEE